MKLSEQEQQMVNWLRRQHKSWRTTRAIILFCSTVFLVYAAWLYFKNDTSGFFIPIIFFSTYGLSYTLGSWAGRPEISLLLRLIDEQNKNDAS